MLRPSNVEPHIRHKMY